MIEMDAERLKVIENIKTALEEGDSFRKVELGDPKITDEDIKRVVEPFDTLRKKPKSKLLSFIARLIAERETKKRNSLTKISGLENAEGIEGGAIITCNHFNFMDNTLPRLLAMKLGKKRKFYIVVQERNVFMTGFFGFLMRNCNTLPVSRSASYMAKNLKPSIKKLLDKGCFILIFPEQEMWFNFKKPRPLRDGAYHYAALFGVPVIPTFTEMITLDGERDNDGFLPVKHILYVLPPIYPDKNLSIRENRALMQTKDYNSKKKCYETIYNTPLDYSFDPQRDIAGLRVD